jgi:hypothetical protein
MTDNKGPRAPDERAVDEHCIVKTAPSPLLQSPITSETNFPLREHTATQLPLPVQLPKTTPYANKTPSAHPSTIGKIVTKLSLSVNHTAPPPHHTQHAGKDPHQHALKPHTRIPQRPRPLNTTIGERATMRDNTTQRKRNIHQIPRKQRLQKAPKERPTYLMSQYL